LPYFQEKIDGPVSGSGAKSYLPMALASMAALAIGGAALFASSSPGTQFITNNGRSLKEQEYPSSLRTLQKSMEKYGEE
jgi:hypothetical protein